MGQCQKDRFHNSSTPLVIILSREWRVQWVERFMAGATWDLDWVWQKKPLINMWTWVVTLAGEEEEEKGFYFCLEGRLKLTARSSGFLTHTVRATIQAGKSIRIRNSMIALNDSPIHPFSLPELGRIFSSCRRAKAGIHWRRVVRTLYKIREDKIRNPLLVSRVEHFSCHGRQFTVQNKEIKNK